MSMGVVIASDPDSDDLFAEIRQYDQPWAEVSFDASSGQFVLTIYPPDARKSHVFGLAEVEHAIAEAKAALRLRGYGTDAS